MEQRRAWLVLLLFLGCQKELTGTPCPCVEPHFCCPVVHACYTAAECPLLDLHLTAGAVSATYGNATGGAPFTMLCGDGEAVIGLRGMGREEVYGLGVDCGKLDLVNQSGQFTVQVTASAMLPERGGNVDPPSPPFSLPCPSSTFVTSVAGTTWHPVHFDELVQTLTIECSSGSVDSEGKLVISAPVQSLSIGMESEVVERFAFSCADGMVNGLSGNAGALIDAIAIGCAQGAVAVH